MNMHSLFCFNLFKCLTWQRWYIYTFFWFHTTNCVFPFDDFFFLKWQFKMEMAQTDPGNTPKSYSLNMFKDFVPMCVFSESSQGMRKIVHTYFQAFLVHIMLSGNFFDWKQCVCALLGIACWLDQLFLSFLLLFMCRKKMGIMCTITFTEWCILFVRILLKTSLYDMMVFTYHHDVMPSLKVLMGPLD